nr:MAG TPA: hypothetical protein [Caudoviricetes sp.]
MLSFGNIGIWLNINHIFHRSEWIIINILKSQQCI